MHTAVYNTHEYVNQDCYKEQNLFCYEKQQSSYKYDIVLWLLLHHFRYKVNSYHDLSTSLEIYIEVHWCQIGVMGVYIPEYFRWWMEYTIIPQ